MNQHHINVVRLKAVRNALEALYEEVVFVGGAVLSLYADKPIIDIRNTNDIDVIIDILSYSHRVTIEEKLRNIGFQNDMTSGIVCRYKIRGLVVDIMPTNDPSIGFHNIWYEEAFSKAIKIALDEKISIKIPTAPHFIATKFEAFKSRGQYDGYSSHDFEDIVFILQNRSTIWEEMSNITGELALYLLKSFDELLNQPLIFDWIEGNVDHTLESNATENIIKGLKNFTKNNKE